MELNSIGILREKPDKKFEFVVRWFFNDKQNPGSVHLPNPEGKFRVHIHKTKSGEYINSQGHLVPRAVGTPDLPVVTPMNYLMASPPKGSQEPPQGPIDPNDLTGTHGIGIYHILADTRSSRTAKKISEKTARLLSARRSLTANALFAELPPADYAEAFARYLVKERVRPRNLQAIFAHSFNRLEGLTFRDKMIAESEQLPSLFHFHLNETYNTRRIGQKFHFDTHLESLWQNAAVLNNLLKDVEYLKAINDDMEKAENLKAQFSLLGLQGGEVIDFWCNPKAGQANRDEAKCGLKYSANEAVGLGFSIGDFELATIQDWFNAQESILIDVSYEAPATAHLHGISSYDWKNLHEEALLDDIPNLDAIQSVISRTGANSLENVLNAKTSCIPDVPPLATVEYDLFLKRVKADLPEELRQKIEFSENLEMGTGDGRVSFKIQKPAEKPFPRIVRPGTGEPISTEASSVVTGINIYGLWEPEDAGSVYKKYFTDSTLQPDPDELAPWLITRRYSYHQELKPFFAETNPNIKENQKQPPRLPAFQYPKQVTNPEKILHVIQDKKVLNEAMPKRNQSEETEEWVGFVLNIREGFKNVFDASIPSTWDKFPEESMEGNWQPDLWRSGTRKAIPQAYRFWATAVDIFGQESRPVPILHRETNNGQPGSLFYFKHRQALQAPPSNTNTETDNIILVTDGNSLTAKWQSPFETDLGNSTDETHAAARPAVRIPKDRLQANVLYLRKPHRKTSQDIDEDKIDAFILEDLFPKLPAGYRNDKWRIGLREILKHNQTWQLHRAFPGVEGTGTDPTWQHRLPLRPLDHGFDYMVLVNFEIRPDKKPFWTENEPKRPLFVSEQLRENAINQDFYASTPTDIEETPGISHTACTDSVLVPDTAAPRQVFLSDHRFLAAKPVLGIQGLNRDMILSNIITTPNAVNEVEIEGKQKLSVVFASDSEEKEEGILYTEGQKIMMDAALSRCRQPEGTDFGLPLQILKNGLSNLNKKVFTEAKDSQGISHYLFSPEATNKAVTGDLSGFRGLMSFAVNYTGIYSGARPAGAESEALKFHVYQIRIPLTGNPETGISFACTRFRQVSPTSYAGVEPDASVELHISPSPVFVIARYAGGFTVAQIKTLKSQAGIYEIETHPVLHREGNPSGNPQKLLFAVSNPITEKEIETDARGQYNYRLLLPIGGGLRELFVWSFQTTSALGKCSDEWITESHVFQSSVLPPVPQVMLASSINTGEQKNTYFLKPAEHKNWLPQRLKNSPEGSLKRPPRNILQWAKDDKLPNDVYLAIERDVRSEEMLKARSLLPVQNHWQLASDIEKRLLVDIAPLLPGGTVNPEYNPHGLLFARWLLPSQKPSLHSWLFESAEIPLPGDTVRSGEEKRFVGPGGALFDPAAPLKAAEGVLMIENRPVFVDYFYDNQNLQHEMDTFRSYNYRLHTYIDLDPDGGLGLTEINLRYLRSRPTEWTGWIRPTFPEIEAVSIVHEQETKIDALMPEIEFRFVFDRPSFRKMEYIPKNLFYRVILKKEIKNSISPDSRGATEKSFVEFGGALDIPVNPDPGAYYGITDTNIDRENNDRELSNNYQIEVLVVAMDSAGETAVIRKAFLQNFNAVKLPACGNDSELRKTLSLQIK